MSVYCKQCGRDVPKERVDGFCSKECKEVAEALKAYDKKKADQ